jgi:O-antigen/teichoic acid export membrane protein
MIRDFLKDSIVYGLSNLFSRGIFFFMIPFYTKLLNPAEYGSLDLITIFASIINLSITLEISQGLARFYTTEVIYDRKVIYASTAFSFTFLSYLIFFILSIILERNISKFIIGQKSEGYTFKLTLLYICANGLFYLIQNQFRWELKSIKYALISLLMSIVTVVTSLYFTFNLHMGLNGILIGMLIGNVSGILLGIYWLRSTFTIKMEFNALRKMLKFSSPLVISSVAVWICLYIDRIMINHYLTINDVGVYAVGYRISSIVGVAMIGFQGALTPLIYKNLQNPNTPTQLAKIFRLFLFCALIIFFTLSLFAKDILSLLTTKSYIGAEPVIVFLIPAILLSNMYIFAPGISIKNKTYYLILVNIGGALLNFVLNIFLIPKYGILGASFATMLGYLLIFVIQMYISEKLYPVPHKWRSLTISIILAILLLLALKNIHLIGLARFLFNIFGLFLFIVMLILLGLITNEEIKKFIGFIFNKIKYKTT